MNKAGTFLKQQRLHLQRGWTKEKTHTKRKDTTGFAKVCSKNILSKAHGAQGQGDASVETWRGAPVATGRNSIPDIIWNGTCCVNLIEHPWKSKDARGLEQNVEWHPHISRGTCWPCGSNSGGDGESWGRGIWLEIPHDPTGSKWLFQLRWGEKTWG